MSMAKRDLMAAGTRDAFDFDAAEKRAAEHNDAIRNGDRDTASAFHADDIVTEPETNTIHDHAPEDVPSPAMMKADRRKAASTGDGLADDVNPRRGRPRGPARKTHSITMPDDIWTEMANAAVDNETNISALLEELWIKKGRRHYAR